VTEIDSSSPVEILLVEDDPGDVLMTKEALADAKMANELHVVSNGEEALAFLFREGEYAEAPRPGLILLDLNLPRVDGREVLARIKADELLRRIPVVVLTTSADEADVLRAYQLHANSYVTKPLELDMFLEAVRSIEGFWLSIVRLPGPA
jgi:CheY-like chemotaxis protein